jgi:hypothetical protein
MYLTDLNQNSGLVLEKVCEYFYYNEKHKNSKDVPDIDVPAELCLELLMAADYLNGKFLPFSLVFMSRCLLRNELDAILWCYIWWNGTLTFFLV